ncbi:MAG TPA: S1C family serine protease [Chthoniobacterales bacterium]
MSLTGFSSRTAAIVLFFASGRLFAQESAVDAISSKVRQLFEEKKSAVVQVEAEDTRGTIRGTGFYIDAMGTLFTLAAMADGTENVSVIAGGKKIPAKVLACDTRSGIALLQTAGCSAFIVPGDSSQLAIASPVVMIGYPLDLDLSPGFGLISGFDRKFADVYFSTTHLRVNVPVMRGQGGSPILNMDGQVVGIVISSVDNGATCYVLPINAAEKILSDYARFGEARHGWVGVKVDPAGEPVQGSSAVIGELDPETPASKSGLKKGDVLLRVGDIEIHKPEDVLDASFFLTAGDTTEIQVLRDGKPVTLGVETVLHPWASKPALQAGPSLMGN